MNMMGNVRLQGFVTIATGDEKYYILAFNLLCSYKLHYSEDKRPFANVCHHHYKNDFDHRLYLSEISDLNLRERRSDWA